MSDQPSSTGRVRPLADLLRAIDEGAALDQAAELLHAASAAVLATGKKGKVTLTVAVAPLTKENNTGQVKVAVSVAASIPPPTAKPAFFYVTDDGLSGRDPRQIAFDDTQLRVLETPDTPAKELPTKKAVNR